MRERRTRAVAAAVLTACLALVAAGCSGDDGGGEALGERPDLPSDPPQLWNPCDGLEPAAVAATFGTELTARTGTEDEPLCSFTPIEDGGPAVDVNYQLYPGTLDELLATFGEVQVEGRTDVTAPEVPAADDARVISDVGDDDVLAVTGFVRNGQLVQVVNALDPAPFDQRAVRRAVTELLTPLAEHASGSGLQDEDAPSESPSGSPSNPHGG